MSNRRKIKPKRYRDRLNAYGAMAPEDMALSGVEFAVEFALPPAAPWRRRPRSRP